MRSPTPSSSEWPRSPAATLSPRRSLPTSRSARSSPRCPKSLPLGDSTPAIVLLSELEPAAYSARATAAALDDLAEEGLLEASIWVLPFLFMAQKTRYRAAGGTSPGPRELTGVAERLALSLRPRGITHVETASCEGPHSLSTARRCRRSKGFADDRGR